MNLLAEIDKELNPVIESNQSFNVGDQVDVHYRIKEGKKERIQLFTGTVIARKGEKSRETFTVRKVVDGEGVEKVMPINSPFIEKVVVKKASVVRQAKLYYLRGRSAKDTRLKAKLISKTPKTEAAK